MSEKLREALSAAVDGEASEFELRRVFDEMAKDESLLRAWRSYHLVKQAAKGENVQGVSEMGERIWASLDAEEFLEQDIVQEEPLADAISVAAPKRGWGLVGGALAAAVALAVVVSGDFLDSGNSTDGLSTPDQIVQNTDNAGAVQPSDIPGVQTVLSDRNLDSFAVTDAGRLQATGLGTGSVPNSGDDEFDYGPGFIPYSELSAADQARSDGYFLHHVQHQAVNNDNVLSFVKMISYPQ